MPFDSGGLEILDVDACRVLLRTTPLGRIVFTHHALPAVQPVNYALAGDDVVIRTSAGSRLAAAASDAVVAFEIDDFDPLTRRGWSVVLVGHARRVLEEPERAEMCRLGLVSWAPGDRPEFIRITPQIVTGRRVPVSAQ